MWVNTLLSFLAKALFKIWTDSVGRIIILRIIAVLSCSKSFSISIKSIEKSGLLLFGLFLFLFFVELCFKHLSRLALVFDSIGNTFNITKIRNELLLNDFGLVFIFETESSVFDDFLLFLFLSLCLHFVSRVYKVEVNYIW